VVYCLLSIAHGNADVERSLSYNKKTLGTARSTMSFETLSGIRMVNDFVKSMKTDLHYLTIPRDMLQSCKLASSNYRKRMRKGRTLKQTERKLDVPKKRMKESSWRKITTS